jgi:hypothetical protein
LPTAFVHSFSITNADLYAHLQAQASQFLEWMAGLESETRRKIARLHSYDAFLGQVRTTCASKSWHECICISLLARCKDECSMWFHSQSMAFGLLVP